MVDRIGASSPLASQGLRSLPPRRGSRCRRHRGQSRNHRYASLRRRRIGAVRTEAPSASAPSHDQEARDYRLHRQMSFAPSSKRQADAYCGVRSIRTDRQARRPPAQSLPTAPFPLPSGPLRRPQNTRSRASRMDGCGRHQCGGHEDSRSHASRGRMNSRPRSRGRAFRRVQAGGKPRRDAKRPDCRFRRSRPGITG